jgi:hypothetical protein
MNTMEGSADQPRRSWTVFLAIVVGFNLMVMALLFAAWFSSKLRPPSPDWNGTWKLDAARSTVSAPRMTVSITPDGMYHSVGAGGGTAKFLCDGKERQATDILTAFCTQKNNSDLEITSFRNGSKVFTAEWELSPDGNTLTIKSTRFHTDGSVKAKESHYTRTSGSTGFVGGWKDVNPLDGSALIWQISVGSRAVHFSYPEREIHADASLNGTDTVFQGQLASPGGTIAVMKRGPREFELTNKMHGQVVSVGYWRISGDGRSLTESYWVPSRSNDKLVRVYDKQ